MYRTLPLIFAALFALSNLFVVVAAALVWNIFYFAFTKLFLFSSPPTNKTPPSPDENNFESFVFFRVVLRVLRVAPAFLPPVDDVGELEEQLCEEI